MICLLSKQPLEDGEHKLKLSSINDPGGYTVIGIAQSESSDY